MTRKGLVPHHITPHDIHYPELLKTLADAPKQLYVIGNLDALREPQIAIVGSRNMTHYGQRNAFEFARDLAKKGLTITSGLALGIDAEAHKGALAAGGQTIAVLGSGVDVISPRQHEALYDQIIEQGGAIVSEYPLGMTANKQTFPQRNRIITGMSVGTLVVEAALSSGSLISARLAMEQNREVFTIPGSIHSPMSRGCHQLLKQGVKCVETSEDILLELQHILAPYITETQALKTIAPPQETHENLSSEYRALLQHIGYDPTSVETVIQRSSQPANEVCSMLLQLELAGYLERIPDGYVKYKDIDLHE